MLKLKKPIRKEISYTLRDFSGENCGLIAVIGDIMRDDCKKMIRGVEHRGPSGFGFFRKKSNNLEEIRHYINTSIENSFPNGFDCDFFMGHTWYPTQGNKLSFSNLQPFQRKIKYGEIILAHNGNLPHSELIKKKLPKNSVFSSSSDSELFFHLFANSKEKNFEGALIETLNILKYGFSLMILDKKNNTFYAIRDQYGIRPLDYAVCDSNIFFASENFVFENFSNEKFNQIPNGHFLKVNLKNPKNPKLIKYSKENISQMSCVFENIYLQSEFNKLTNKKRNYKIREDFGKKLYEEIEDLLKVDKENCLVVPVLRSGKFGAKGFCKASKFKYGESIQLSKFYSRSFLANKNFDREKVLEEKFLFLPEKIIGREIFLFDDSIVRGNTTKFLIKKLKKYGATNIHLLSSSPKIISPCPFGIDLKTKEELLMPNKKTCDVAREIGASSIHFLSLKGLLEVFQKYGVKKICNNCFTNKEKNSIKIDKKVKLGNRKINK